MKYFIDTEFIEGFHKPLFGKRRHFIDIISIGIVAEDGREYYAVSSEYNYNDANKWVQENVIIPLYQETIVGDNRNRFDADRFHKTFGKPNKQIAKEIMAFVNPFLEETPLHTKSWNKHLNKFNVIASENRPIEFYAYYADYDWVVFCSLFGRMIDLPKGFPMYCRDLKQALDEKAYNLPIKNRKLTDSIVSEGSSFKERLDAIKELQGFPKQENEHNALDDAKWNKELYNFLQSF